jgi:ribonuclease Z
MEITFLGTSSMVPTKERNHSGLFIKYDTEGILIDCGEGTQRQLKIAGIKPSKVTRVIISHWHGDHVLGLPGLIQTLAKTSYDKKLHIYGPKGSSKRIKKMLEVFEFDNTLDMEVHEIRKQKFLDAKKYSIKAYQLSHGVPTLAFRFEEKDRRRIKTDYIKKIGLRPGPLLGKLQAGHTIEFKGKKITPREATYTVKGKIVAYIADTEPCKNCITAAKDADLLISESTYTTKDKEKAEGYLHLTTQEAAQIATQAGAKKLVLTHFSPRYKDLKEVEEDAKTFFKEVQCAHDFLKVHL